MIFRKIVFVLHKIRENGIQIIFKKICLLFQQRAQNDEFDKGHDYDTAGVIPLYRLTIDSINAKQGVGYRASPPELVYKTLSELPIKHSDYTFIDLGAGKGRVLIIAARLPFRRIIGVEFAKELAAIAENNVRGLERISVFCCDAVLHEYPPGDLVIYMYNPFERPVLEKIMPQIAEAAKTRTIYIVYLQLKNADIVEKYATEILPESWMRVFKMN